MDQAILNLMLTNMDGSTEDSSSETNSITDEFELMNTQCKGNCYQKLLKSLLQEAGKMIKLKDQQIESKDRQIELKDSQIENHVKTISTLSIKCLEIHKHYMENQMGEKTKEVSQLVSKYQDQLKESNASLNDTQNSPETQKEQLKDQLADQTKAKEDQLNALLEESNKKVENLFAQLSEAESKLKDANALLDESNEKVKLLEIEKQQMENNYETKINKPENKEYETVIKLAGCGTKTVTINNDIAGPRWIVIKRFQRQNGSLKKTIDVGSYWVYYLTKDHPHELYIHIKNKDGSTLFAHYDDFALHPWDEKGNKIKSMGVLRTSMAIIGDFSQKYFSSISDLFFISECTLYTIMVRQYFNDALPRLITE